MKNNFSSSKKPKIGFIFFLLLFCFLSINMAMGQTTFTWTGITSSDWATSTNWTRSGGTNTTFPGAQPTTDLVVISKNDAPNAPVISSGSYTVNRMTINNAVGTIAGATLTINSGATLIITTATSTALILNGGNLVNNGTLTINNSAAGSSGFEAKGITCGPPAVAPTILNPTVFSYSGNGVLNVNLTNVAAFANSSAVAVTALNVFATYNILFNGTTTFTLSSSGATNTTYAIRAAGTAAAAGSPLIIGGAGFTLNNNGGLIAAGTSSNVTVNSGTILTLNSASNNLTSGLLISNASASALTFINKGIINILGSSGRSGLQFNTFTQAAAVPFTVTNEGTINVNLNSSTTGSGALITGNGGGAGGSGTSVNINNTGNLFLKNTSTAAGRGAAIFGLVASEAPPVALTNNGTLTLDGTCYSYGNKFSIVNNSVLNTNSELRSFTNLTNNVGGVFNFIKTNATATSKQVTFSVPAGSTAGLGTIYSDAGSNNYAVVSQTFGVASMTLVTNVLSSVVNIPLSGNLTRVGDGTNTIGNGTGDATIAFTSVTVPDLNGALTSTTTNSGTINTDTESNLNIISGVSAASTGVIAPGGSAGKGVASFSTATQTINGKLNLQVSGKTTAGVDYDQITNIFTDGGFNITGATLDITGISGTATPVDIMLANGAGTITGTFASVIGLTSGWSVDYSTAGKVQLVFTVTSPTATTWTGATSTSWTDATNWTAGLPDSAKDVTIAAAANQPILGSNASVKSLTLDASTSLTVTSGSNLTVTGAIANGGTMTLDNNANLIQGGTTNTNTGNVIVKRNSNALHRLDYTMWSSPVAGTQTLASFSPLTSQTPNRFYTFDATANQYVVAAFGSPFALGTGYLIRMPNTDPTVNYDAGTATLNFSGVFTGKPNNGDISVTTVPNKFNGIGNPYPSAIDADLFKASNTDINTLYFWRKTNNPLQGTSPTTSYAVYNIATATGTGVAPDGAAAGEPTITPDKYIQIGQGFVVETPQTNVVFNNAMRAANNGNKFLKTKQIVKSRIWLNLSNSSWPINQMALCYIDGASASLDETDSKYINDSPIALTSNINNVEYTIQGRPAFDPSDVAPLNFKTDVAGDYTIALDHFDGVFATGQDVYLVDSKTGTETNLKTGSYTFVATAGADNARFSLKYQRTLDVNASVFNENSVNVYKNNGMLYVNSGSLAISNIKVFDIQGRLIAEQKNLNATSAIIKDLRASNHVLIVKIEGEDSSVVTKKVMN